MTQGYSKLIVCHSFLLEKIPFALFVSTAAEVGSLEHLFKTRDPAAEKEKVRKHVDRSVIIITSSATRE